jgi:predicted hydrolase (HD superfamily)
LLSAAFLPRRVVAGAPATAMTLEEKYMVDRNQAIALWRQYNEEDSLFRHALSVEAAMRHFAEKYDEDVEFWGIVGLLHDVDYGRFPKEHLAHARTILEEAGCGEVLIRAVLSHGWGLCSDVEPILRMEKVLYAVDELTGFIAACAYVRPSRSVLDMEVKSVKKKWKAAGFAAGVNRDVVEKGAAMMGVSLDELIEETILALRKAAAEVGLKGSA